MTLTTFRGTSCACLLLAFSTIVGGQQGVAGRSDDLTPHSDVALVADVDALRPGTSATVALRITMDAGWHTYWTNPGDAGLPLTARWTLPSGVTVSSLRFPTPHVLPQPPLMSFGYEREVLVLADVTVDPTVPIGQALTLKADVDFLVCADVCLPASAQRKLSTRTAAQVSPSRWSAAIAATRAQLPQGTTDWRAMAWRDGSRVLLMLLAPHLTEGVVPAAYLIPDSIDVLEHAAAQRVVWSGDTLVLALTAARGLSDTASRLTGVLLNDAANPSTSFAVNAPLARAAPRGAVRLVALLDDPRAINTGGATTVGAADRAMVTTARSANSIAANTSAAAAANTGATDIGIWLAILLAFVGGIILNLMPCVFPVLSVKILAFVERGGDADQGAHGRRHAMVFTLGVLTTFWALAGALLALRAGGAQLGWGFQLQSPAVVTVLALVVFALALNLSGVFAMGMSLTRLGAVGGGARYVDSFLTGLLAVIVATPCTAPFMGAALGYAVTQNVATGMAVFTALGLGLAAPYIGFASSPSLLRLLPRPGPWLETLKQLLAFPLYATVVWLLWVLGRQTGSDQVALVLLMAILVALAGWFAGRAQQTGRSRASVFGLTALLLAIVGGGVVIASQRATPTIATDIRSGWERWSPARVAAARDSGRLVFVDFTAAWCLSCQVNERSALHTDAVERAFAENNVVLLRADWTSRDADITAVLSSFGRSGVPLYVMYPSRTDEAPDILPAVLTPGIVVDAVKRAGLPSS